MSRYDSELRHERRKLYRTEEWKGIADEVWKRDKGTCQRCKVKKFNGNKPDATIHHIVGFAVSWMRMFKPNLILLCTDCHTFVHSSENVHREFLSDDETGIQAAIQRGRADMARDEGVD